jgi:hypothetical protein
MGSIMHGVLAVHYDHAACKVYATVSWLGATNHAWSTKEPLSFFQGNLLPHLLESSAWERFRWSIDYVTYHRIHPAAFELPAPDSSEEESDASTSNYVSESEADDLVPPMDTDDEQEDEESRVAHPAAFALPGNEDLSDGGEFDSSEEETDASESDEMDVDAQLDVTMEWDLAKTETFEGVAESAACPICYDSFQDETMVSVLPCMHVLCGSCYPRWPRCTVC